MLELWKLQRQRKRLLKRFPKFGPDHPWTVHEEFLRAQKDWRGKLRAIEDKISHHATDQIIRQAEKYDVAVPSMEPPEVEYDYEYTPEFRSQLRKLIDEEKARKRENYAWWWRTVILPAITALTGLGGVIIGILSYLHSHK